MYRKIGAEFKARVARAVLVEIAGLPLYNEVYMDRDDRWIIKHFDRLVSRYSGEYVAVVKEQVIAHGVSPRVVEQKARSRYPHQIPSLLLVPREKDLTCVLLIRR